MNEACAAAIRRYFSCWLRQDGEALSELLSEDCQYTECYGPQYHGLEQICRWFSDWNQRGRVLRWDILEMLHTGSTTVCRWYFECEYDGTVDGFDGLSLIRFDDGGSICEVQEYQSKHQHYQPYGA